MRQVREADRKLSRRLFSLKKLKSKEFWALKNINFRIPEGEVLGVIGGNGAGKTTLLRVLSGVLEPDTGTLEVNGRVTALLGLGTGFNSELSGRDNLYLNAMYLGMSEKEMEERFDEVVEFSGIGDFIDTPIRYYSSGMKARLGFSLAVNVEPDILIVDEVLATGDSAFQEKARDKMQSLLQKAKALIICSHNITFIQEICNQVIWLNHGEIHMQGDTASVTEAYLDSTRKK